MESNILALISFFLTVVAVLGEENIAPPTWSQKYYVKGVLHIPYADIHEPVEAWYDGVSKEARIDFYDETTKTYQLGTIGYGAIFKIVPFTTKNDDNIVQCFKVVGNKHFKIVPQTVLPSLEGFIYTGKEQVNGELADRWEMNETDYHVVSKYKVLITYKVNPINNEKIAVPLRFEMLGYNHLLGSHCDHYYLEYSSFSDGDIPQSIFEVGPDICSHPLALDLVGHLHTFNPMAEFIRPKVSSHVDSEFEKFKSKHKISYKNENEHIRRKDIFRQNLRYIHSTNRRNLGYSLATNHLADKHIDELKVMRGLRYSDKYSSSQSYVNNEFTETNIPENFDWRDEGAVSPVKDQAICGSCWSFSAIGAIEGAYFLHHNGSLVRFSEQALVDCSWGYGNTGCDGGYTTSAFKWILHHESVPTEADYGHYLGDDGRCHVEKVPVGVKITGWVKVPPKDEDALRSAVFKNGPVTIGICAEPRSFGFYSDGIYNDPKCSSDPRKMDHAVLLVGYGSVNGQKYWLVKNSWSTYWGDHGYIRIAVENNICGVMNDPIYVTL